jgi:hypothetical protein
MNKLRSYPGIGFDVTTIISCLLFHTASVLLIMFNAEYPSAIDEHAHVSYVHYIATQRVIFPDHQRIQFVGADSADDQGSMVYLGHPSLYYHALAALHDPKAPQGQENTLRLRAANAVMSIAALALILLVGVKLFDSRLDRLTFCIGATAFPKIGVLGGLINNDNLAFLASAIFFLGLFLFTSRKRGAGLMVAATGLAIAGWTKLTAVLMLGIAGLSAVALILLVSPKESLRSGYKYFGVLIAGILVGSIPYLVHFIQHGSLLYRNVDFFTALAAARHSSVLSFGQYTVAFVQSALSKWAAIEPSHPLQILGLVAFLLITAIGLWRLFLSRSALPSVAIIAWSYAVAFVVVLGMHFAFGWQHHQDTGHMIASYSRYYYALWPGLTVGFACFPTGIRRLGPLPRSVTLVLLVASTLPCALILNRVLS